MSRPVSNPLALAVLACLWERPMYPYEITTTLRERHKQDSIRLNFGSLYAVIKSLTKHGLIDIARTEREGNRPERVVYEITDTGRTEAEQWLRELIEQPVKEYPAIETGLSLLMMIPPEEAASLLRARVERLGVEIDSCNDVPPEFDWLPELFVIELEYKVAMLKAERAVIAGFAERIETGALGGHEIWAKMHRMLAEGRPMSEVGTEIAHYFEQEAAEQTTE